MIQARGLSFAYEPGGWALEDVDVEVAAGDMLFVLGPNGSGKSTLMQLLCGGLRPAAGEVRLGGTAAAALDARSLARLVAVVPQALDGVGGATVEGFVSGGRYPHLGLWRRPGAPDRAAVERALERAEIAELRERMLDELSGGQRQRALVARALAQEAPALLLDEPTAALDPEHQIHLLELVRNLAQSGSGVVVVTHDLNLTSQFASRVLLLDGGRKVAEGPVEDVLTSAVLEPVYGQRLLFERFPGSGRPLVVPWSRDGV